MLVSKENALNFLWHYIHTSHSSIDASNGKYYHDDSGKYVHVEGPTGPPAPPYVHVVGPEGGYGGNGGKGDGGGIGGFGPNGPGGPKGPGGPGGKYRKKLSNIWSPFLSIKHTYFRT